MKQFFKPQSFLALLGMVLWLVPTQTSAQNVDDIIDKYVTTIGGKDKWTKLTGMRMKATVQVQGMTLPLDIINLSDGRSYTSFELQGKVIQQDVFDGTVLWGVNFMTMKPEKMDAEATENRKRDAKDFPSDIMDYKSRGYSAELVGKETAEGVSCFKIKLTKKAQLVDGKEEDNIVYYYIDTENYVPIMTEATIKSGEAKGQVAQTVFSDYQEVNGIYFPFSITSRLKDGAGQTVTFTSIELNPKVEDSLFKFPEN